MGGDPRAIRKWAEEANKQQDQDSTTSVTIEGSVHKGRPRHATSSSEIGVKTFCPVKVNYTLTIDYASRLDVYYWKGGVCKFFKNDFGER